MIIGNQEFDTKNRCYIMAILNVAPDSFSDGGKWATPEKALLRVEELIKDGADIIDVGGESTRPGYSMISESEEIDRVAPVIEALSGRFEIPISIDTYKSAVAEVGLNAGAVFINDIRGLKYDPKMAGLIGHTGASCCLMHNRENADYSDFMPDLLTGLLESVELAKNAGIKDNKIVLDPGVGFDKTYEMDLEVIYRLNMVVELGYPVLLGTSRKRVIGTTLGLPVDERVEGTLATTVIGVMRGCSFIRAHDVKETKRAITMTEAVLRGAERTRNNEQ